MKFDAPIIIMSIYLAVLFFLLTPGVLVSLPPGAGKTVTTATHATVFAVVYLLSHKLVWKAVSSM